MIALKSCPQCSGGIPVAAPEGLCPTCLLRLAAVGTPRPDETPRSGLDSTGFHHPEPTNATTAEHAQHDTNGTAWPARDAKPTRQVPAVLGTLDVFEEIGHGGMGVVYRAKQRLANREVAVKVLASALATRGRAAERFSGEIEALAKLRHPNIVEVYEVGEDSGCIYFSMELVRGGTLASRAKRQPLEPAEAAAMVEQLAVAVHAAHVVGLLHRDIKPANVLLTAEGSPKLSDFGLAKWMDREDGLTETGAVLGTPSYMAPEQAVGSQHGTLGPPTDVYGLGATLYDLLTGRPPFRAASTFETLQKVIHEPPMAPRTLSPAVPPDLEAVCLKCLEKDPARRYATAQELANDLHRWCIGDPTRARPLSWPRKVWQVVRKRSRWIGAVAALAAAVGIGIYIATEGPPTADKEMRALRRGEKVILIGETGAPRYHRWAVGMGEAGEQGAGKQFMAFALETGLLELLPDSQTDRYRFSAEFHVDASVKTDSKAGIYFAHNRSVLDGRVAVDRIVTVEFNDDHLTQMPFKNLKLPEPGKPSVYDPVTIREGIYYGLPTGKFKAEVTPLTYLRVMDPLDSAGMKKWDQIPWRQIVATVGPDDVRVEWRDPDGTYRPVGIESHRLPFQPAIPTSKLMAREEHYKGELKKDYPGIDTSGFKPYSPRGGVGLYVYGARVLFRNVVIEPLAPTATP